MIDELVTVFSKFSHCDQFTYIHVDYTSLVGQCVVVLGRFCCHCTRISHFAPQIRSPRIFSHITLETGSLAGGDANHLAQIV